MAREGSDEDGIQSIHYWRMKSLPYRIVALGARDGFDELRADTVGFLREIGEHEMADAYEATASAIECETKRTARIMFEDVKRTIKETREGARA